MDRTCILQLMINLSEGAIIEVISGYGKLIIMKIQASVKKRTDKKFTQKSVTNSANAAIYLRLGSRPSENSVFG